MPQSRWCSVDFTNVAYSRWVAVTGRPTRDHSHIILPKYCLLI